MEQQLPNYERIEHEDGGVIYSLFSRYSKDSICLDVEQMQELQRWLNEQADILEQDAQRR